MECLANSINDQTFEEIASDKQVNIKNKSNDVSELQKMDRILYLSTKLLKNTEKATIDNLKYNSYVQIIKCLMYYYKEYLEYINEQVKINQKILFFKIYIKFPQVITQFTLYYTIGTSELRTVIREKIINDMNYPDINGYEKFISIFLYAGEITFYHI